MPRTRNKEDEAIIESYNTLTPAAFPDDSPIPHKKVEQNFPEMPPFDSDHLQFD